VTDPTDTDDGRPPASDADVDASNTVTDPGRRRTLAAVTTTSTT